MPPKTSAAQHKAQERLARVAHEAKKLHHGSTSWQDAMRAAWTKELGHAPAHRAPSHRGEERKAASAAVSVVRQLGAGHYVAPSRIEEVASKIKKAGL